MPIPYITACALAGQIAIAAPFNELQSERLELTNGIRALIMHAPDAPRQTIFCFLPVHLANDSPGQPQWSHLLEHMLIRSTDPETLNPPGMLINGETMHHSMRLEIFAEPEKWPEAINRCAQWMTARTFSDAVLQREKQNIAMEERYTASRGFTSKWAIAAWNQAVRHGDAHVELHASAANAALADVEQAATKRVPIDRTILIATIGPADPAALRTKLVEAFEPLESASRPPEAAQVQPFVAQRTVRATWDLPVSHALVWWQLPDQKPHTLAAATVIASHIRMHADHSREKLTVFEHVPTPEGMFFIVDVASAAELPDVDALHKRMRDMLNTLTADAKNLSAPGALIARSLAETPDFSAMRRRIPEPQASLMEGQWLLARSMIEYVWDEPIEAVIAALAACDGQQIAALAQQMLDQPAGTLTLHPPKQNN